MKMVQSTKFFFMILFGLTAHFSYGQGLKSSKDNERAEKEVMQDNEFKRSEIGLTENVHCNPLLLDGQPLDYGNFTINSKGVLTLVKGDPESLQHIKIPFSVQLRRNGKIIDNKNIDFLDKELYSIEISKVLALGKPGDQLIIDPKNKEDWKAKRILKLIL